MVDAMPETGCIFLVAIVKLNQVCENATAFCVPVPFQVLLLSEYGTPSTISDEL